MRKRLPHRRFIRYRAQRSTETHPECRSGHAPCCRSEKVTVSVDTEVWWENRRSSLPWRVTYSLRHLSWKWRWWEDNLVLEKMDPSAPPPLPTARFKRLSIYPHRCAHVTQYIAITLAKRADGACAYLRPDNRCGIYRARPQACRAWFCDMDDHVWWLMGEERNRPEERDSCLVPLIVEPVAASACG